MPCHHVPHRATKFAHHHSEIICNVSICRVFNTHVGTVPYVKLIRAVCMRLSLWVPEIVGSRGRYQVLVENSARNSIDCDTGVPTSQHRQLYNRNQLMQPSWAISLKTEGLRDKEQLIQEIEAVVHGGHDIRISDNNHNMQVLHDLTNALHRGIGVVGGSSTEGGGCEGRPSPGHPRMHCNLHVVC